MEHSVYVHVDRRGKGSWPCADAELIEIDVEKQVHVTVGGIDVTNSASIALHEKLGFVHAGIIRQAGFKVGRWLDLGFYQLILDTPTAPVDG